MSAYYNEIDPYAVQWLRELIARDLIAPGVVDERDIQDISPTDLHGFSQCHFFAGIGVWSYALRQAGWPDDQPVWTGSCPCQPFSAAGKGGGFDDERHLWPAWHWLIEQCRPAIVFGEQVASKDAEPWLDLVQADLEAMAYAVGAIPFPSASVGAPHIRDRLYWVGHSLALGELADNGGARLEGGNARSMGEQCTSSERNSRGEFTVQSPASATNGFWRVADWLFCRDERWRPVEPGTFPLAHGAAARVGRLRGYGNAINAEAAAAFVASYLEVRAA